LKRSWIPAIIVFGGALALANFVLVPLYCRGGFAVPFLDRANHCLTEGGLTRSSSLLLYFGIVALALLIGILFDRLPRRAPAAAEAKQADAAKPAAEPVEQAAAVTPTPSVAPTPAVAASEAPKAEVPKPDAEPAAEAAKPDTPKPDAAPEAPVDLAAVIEAALKSNAPLPTPAPPPPVLPKPAPSSAVTPPAVPKPAPMPSVTPGPTPTASTTLPPAPVLPPPPKPTPIPKPWQKPKAFDGTNEELIARFKELAREGGVEAIAAAQRNLDESTLAALGGGVDPKQHLSQIAHLLLIEDPDLKSEVTRGVIVHIAARLKELGVVTDLQPKASA
jgi:hypothetical protein